jgi:hypothetical protein
MRENDWYTGVSRALLTHASTLESLIIDGTLKEDRTWRGALEQPSTFLCLRNLEVPLETLVGVDTSDDHGDLGDLSNIPQLLPASIETVTLFVRHDVLKDRGRDMAEVVQQASEAIYTAFLNGWLPRLKAIEFMLRYDMRPFSVPTFEIEHFRAMLRDRNIHLDVSLWGVGENESMGKSQAFSLLILHTMTYIYAHRLTYFQVIFVTPIPL